MKLRFLLVSLAIVFGGSANIYAQKKKSVVRSLFTGVCSFAFSPSQSKETEKTDVQKKSSTPTTTSNNQEAVSLQSDVDVNIPQTSIVNSNTFAVIIANETYRRVETVPFALNDGKVFKKYCEKVLGLPSRNIHLVENATLGDIHAEVNWITRVMNAFQGDARVIIYYAGHGIPDIESKQAYLLPVDGIATETSTAYSLEKLYRNIGKAPAKSITYFIDACFTGSKREDGMLASARGVSIKTKSNILYGNSVVFSAAANDQTAYPMSTKRHGMFTYFLLKKLQETRGNITYSDLANYLQKEVAKEALLGSGHDQIPSIVANSTIESDWKKWRLF